MITILVLSIFVFLLLAVRLVRWVAWVQQREYRWDRLRQFFISGESIEEFFRWPRLTDFTRTGLKRPVRTGRAMIVFFMVTGVLGVSTGLLWEWLVTPWFLVNVFRWLTLGIVFYFLLPIATIGVGFLSALPVGLVTRWYLYKAKKLVVERRPVIVGITGSFGKTSTKQLISWVLGKRLSVYMTPSSYNTPLSVARSVLSGFNNQDVVVIEFGAYRRGEISHLARIFRPSIAVVTGIGTQHVGLFGSPHNLIKAKAELVEALPFEGTLFYNGKDENVVAISRTFSGKKVDYSGLPLTVGSLTKRGELVLVWGGRTVATRIVGRHYLGAVQAAVAVGQASNVSKDLIIDALESFESTDAFVRTSLGPGGALIVDDGGTSNPDGFRAIVKLAEEFPRAKKYLLFGGIVDLGETSERIHGQLAEHAKAVFAEVWYLGTVGKEAFRKEFGERLVDETSVIVRRIQALKNHELIVIEGRVPRFLSSALGSDYETGV